MLPESRDDTSYNLESRVLNVLPLPLQHALVFSICLVCGTPAPGSGHQFADPMQIARKTISMNLTGVMTRQRNQAGQPSPVIRGALITSEPEMQLKFLLTMILVRQSA